MPAPIAFRIESIQYTAGREPVLVQYRAAMLKTGPFARTLNFSTTQTELQALRVPGTPWDDAEVVTALETHLAENGVNGVVEVPD
jgi:hypothetical protein